MSVMMCTGRSTETNNIKDIIKDSIEYEEYIYFEIEQ